MYNRRFQTQITTGHFTLPVAIILSILCWISSALFASHPIEATPGNYPLWKIIHETSLPHWVLSVTSFILYGLIGYLLIELNNRFAIIRMRASVQTVIFVLLVAICPAIHTLSAGTSSAIALLMALFFLFKSYQNSNASTDLFYTFFCLGIGSLLLPSLIWTVPIFWIGAYGFQSLNPKSFFASLIGGGVPYWFLFSHAYFHQEMELFYAPFQQMITFHPIHFQFQPWQIALQAYLLLLYIVSATHCLITGYEDKIRTRSYLQFLILLTFCIFLYIGLQPQEMSHLLPMQLTGVSFLAGHLFVLTNSRSSNVFFICILIGLCLLFSYNLWMLL